MNQSQNQLKQESQKQFTDEDIISILEQQLETQNFKDQKQALKQQISEHLPVYQKLVISLTQVQKPINKFQTINTNSQKNQSKIFTECWESHRFKPSLSIPSLTLNSIKYEPYSKPFFSQSFFIQKASLNGSFLTVNVIISNFVMKLHLLVDNNFLKSEGVFQQWQTKQLKYLDSGSFSDIYEYFDRKQKQIIAVKKIKFSKASQLSFETVIYQYAFLKLAAALGIGLEIKPIFGFDLVIRNQDVFFGMQIGTKSCQTSTDINQLSQNIMSSLILLHSLKIVHCDLRPQNIEFSQSLKKYVLIDYGLSQCLEQQLGYKSLVSNFKGTYHYSSPQMQKLFFSQNKYVDMYFNDLYCLKKTIQEQKSNRQINLALNLGRQTKQTNFEYSNKQYQKSIENNYIDFNFSQSEFSLINLPKVLQTVFYIYNKNISQFLQEIKTLNFQQVLLVIKAFYDLQIDGQYKQTYNHCFNAIKKRNFLYRQIQNQFNQVVRNNTFHKDSQRQGISLIIEKFQQCHFYFQGRSYLKQMWNFYQYNIFEDFVNFHKRKLFKSFQQQQPDYSGTQNIYCQIQKRRYKHKELRTTKIAWKFFMFLKQKQKFHSNQKIQTILMLQFCLHYCQILLNMHKKAKQNSFQNTYLNSSKQKSNLSQSKGFQKNETTNWTIFFSQVNDLARGLLKLNQLINSEFFFLISNKKQLGQDLKQKNEQAGQQMYDQILTLKKITMNQLLKRLKPSSTNKSQNQKDIFSKVNLIFIQLFYKFIFFTSRQILFNLQQHTDHQFQQKIKESKVSKKQQKFPTNIKAKFYLYFKKRPINDLTIIVSIIFVLAKVFYQSSSFSFQQKYNLSLFITKYYTQVVTNFTKSHYLLTIKFQQKNQPLLKIDIDEEFIDFGGFRKIQEKIVQIIQYLFESYSLILDFIVEQDFTNKNCIIDSKRNTKEQKIRIYQQFKDLFQFLSKEVKFYQVIKKVNQNEPIIIFTSKENQQSLQFQTNQSIKFLDCYFQKFHFVKQFQNLNCQNIITQIQGNYPICLSKFFKQRFLLVCQQISLYLKSLCLKIKTNLKFSVSQNQFYKLFSQIDRFQNYQRKQEQKVCVILRYADYLFQKENIMQTIYVLEKLNERVSQKQIIRVNDVFFKNRQEKQNYKNKKQNHNLFLKMRKKNSSFNLLVIQQNLFRIYRFMKSDKTKNIVPFFQRQQTPKNNQDKQISINQKVQKINEQTFSMKERVLSINRRKQFFNRNFEQIINKIVNDLSSINFQSDSSRQKNLLLFENSYENINFQITQIKQELNKLNQYLQQNGQNFHRSFHRKVKEQFFHFLTFQQHNTSLVLEKLWTISRKVRKKSFQIDNKNIQHSQICFLKKLARLMMDHYSTDSQNFLKNIRMSCDMLSQKGNRTQNQQNQIERNDISRLTKFQQIIEKKSQLIKQIFFIVIEQKQKFPLDINRFSLDYDQEDKERMNFCIDLMYYYLRFSYRDQQQVQKILSQYDNQQQQFHIKIVNYLLTNKIHAIFSSRRQHLIFIHYLKIKLWKIHNSKQFIDSNQSKTFQFDLFKIFSKLSNFLQTIQSFQFTKIFLNLLSDLAHTSGFSTFILQIIKIFFQKQNSNSNHDLSKNQGHFTNQIIVSCKKNIILMTFYLEALINCSQFNEIILGSLSLKRKMSQQYLSKMKTFCNFFQYIAYMLEFGMEQCNESLKKYLIQKRQILKYFLIIYLYKKLLNSPKQYNRSNYQNQIQKISFKQNYFNKMIINNFRKIKKYKIKLQIQQKFILNQSNLRFTYFNDASIKLISSKLIKKHKKWIQINNPNR